MTTAEIEAMIAKASPELRPVLRSRMYPSGPPPIDPPPPPTPQSSQLKTTAELAIPPGYIPLPLPEATVLVSAGVLLDRMAQSTRAMNLAMAGLEWSPEIAAGATAGAEGGSLLGPVGIVAGLAVGTAIAAGVYLYSHSSNSGSSTSTAVQSSTRAAVAGASPSSPATVGGPTSDLNGTYVITWGDGIGGCPASKPPPTMTMKLSSDTITVTLGGQTMSGSVTSSGGFAANFYAQNSMRYHVEGVFAKEPITVQGGVYDVTTEVAGCGYTFTAAKR